MALLLCLTVVASCAPGMQSRAVSDYTGTLKRVMIVATEGPIPLGAEWTAFEGRIQSGLQACGIATELQNLPKEAAAGLMRRLQASETGGQADAVLRVQPVGGTATLIGGHDVPESVEYETLVVERSSNRALFRGRVSIMLAAVFRPSGSLGDRAARTLLKQLSTDGIVRTCPGT